MAAKNAEISKRLKEWALSRFGSVGAFADAMDMTQPSASQLLNGRWLPGRAVQEKLRKHGCDVEWLMTGEKIGMVREPPGIYGGGFGEVPVLGKVLATPEGKQYFEALQEGVTVPYFKGPFFALVVENDSLIDAPEGDRSMPIYPDDIVLFDSSRQPRNGDIVAIHLKQDDTRMIKVMRHKSKHEIELLSYNKFRNYPAVKIRKSQIATYGVFVTVLKMSKAERRRLGI